MATRSRQTWKLDNQGEYPRQVGWKFSRNGKLIQHKFRLGDDLKEARRREQKLLELWGQVEFDSTEQPVVWTTFALEVARQVAKGKFQIEVPRKPHDSPEAYARYLHRLQRHYPMVSFVAEDEEAYVSGAAANRLMVEGQIDELRGQIATRESRHLRTGNIDGLDLSQSGPMLHDAMRAYIDWIKKDYFRPALGRVNDGGRTKIRQVEILMTRHENVPLSGLDEAAVEEMFRFWRQRPLKKDSTKPISKKSAENYIGELKRFFRWLHKSKDFDWRKPENFDEIKTKVDAAPGDQQRKLVQVDTFSLDELKLLNEYATPLERVFLLLGVNCATCPETRIPHGNIGLCHGWAAGPAMLLPAYVLGIQPAAGGWSLADFRPHPADLPAAAGELRTPRGPLKAAWSRHGDRLKLTLEVPPAVTVRVACRELRQTVQGPAQWEGTAG